MLQQGADRGRALHLPCLFDVCYYLALFGTRCRLFWPARVPGRALDFADSPVFCCEHRNEPGTAHGAARSVLLRLCCRTITIQYLVPEKVVGSANGIATSVQMLGIGLCNIAVGKLWMRAREQKSHTRP